MGEWVCGKMIGMDGRNGLLVCLSCGIFGLMYIWLMVCSAFGMADVLC